MTGVCRGIGHDRRRGDIPGGDPWKDQSTLVMFHIYICFYERDKTKFMTVLLLSFLGSLR